MDNDKYIGRLLDNRYEILEVIGSGGMAVVYKARCHRLNRLVAIKILKDDYLEDEDFRRRFHAESQAVAMFSHPNIVSVYDVSTSVSLEADYIVMELIDGISLKQYMEKKGVLNWKETLHFAIQIAKALEHAHSRGIVHRDIKPHNIMVLKNGSVKVADFGIARMMSKGNTLTKEALGSVHYISPEQAKGGRVDTRSDIYSLGVVMYEMMTGRPPYDGDSPVSVAIKHIDGGAAMPSVLNPNIPGGLEQIIMKAMAHNIEDRYTTASQMLGDMDEFRKDPTMLFGYNAAALDAVIQFPKKPVDSKPVNSTADRVVNRTNPQRRPSGAKPPQRQSAQSQAARKRRQEAEAKSDKVSTIAIIICSILVVCGIAVILWFSLVNPDGTTSESLVKVPNLVGQQSASVPEYEDFEIIWKEEFNDTVEKGKIISTDPEAGTEVSKGAKITVVVSSGPAPAEITMLNLVDLNEERARNRLDSLGLNLDVQTAEEHNGEITVGNVIRTEPAAGAPLEAGQKITLYLSKGPEAGVMPNLIGLESKVAQDILDKQNLKLKITVLEEYNSTATAGEVLRTEPQKGEELKAEQEVTLYVSKGAELKVVPPVVGSSLDSAKKSLFDAGFTKAPEVRYVESDKAEGTVIKQTPEAYTQADVNTVVVLEIAKAKTVTKDVSISIGDAAQSAGCTVEIKRGGQSVFSGEVAQGTTTVTLYDETGTGSVVYEIYINGTLKTSHTEVF